MDRYREPQNFIDELIGPNGKLTVTERTLDRVTRERDEAVDILEFVAGATADRNLYGTALKAEIQARVFPFLRRLSRIEGGR